MRLHMGPLLETQRGEENRTPAHASESGVPHEVVNGHRDEPLTECYPQEAPPSSLHSA